MVLAEDIRKTILKLADECGTEKTFGPSEVARSIDKENWPLLLDQVQFVASVLIKEGKIAAAPTGEGADFAKANHLLRFKKLC
jgi:hypothetical protein